MSVLTLAVAAADGASTCLCTSSSACRTEAALLTATSTLGMLPADSDAVGCASGTDAGAAVGSLVVTTSAIDAVIEDEGSKASGSISLSLCELLALQRFLTLTATHGCTSHPCKQRYTHVELAQSKVGVAYHKNAT